MTLRYRPRAEGADDAMRPHPYTLDSEHEARRSRLHVVLALVSFFLVYGTRAFFIAGRDALGLSHKIPQQYLDQAAFLVGSAGLFLVYGILVLLFDRYFWNVKQLEWIWRLLGIPCPADLAGNYVGRSRWYNKQHDGMETQVHVKIRQTWSRLLITLQHVPNDANTESSSYSTMATLLSSDETCRLSYCFIYESKERSSGPPFSVRRLLASGTQQLSLRLEYPNGGWRGSGLYYMETAGSGELILDGDHEVRTQDVLASSSSSNSTSTTKTDGVPDTPHSDSRSDDHVSSCMALWL